MSEASDFQVRNAVGKERVTRTTIKISINLGVESYDSTSISKNH